MKIEYKLNDYKPFNFLKKFLICITPIVVTLVLFLFKGFYSNLIQDKFLPCWFYVSTGYQCPGCGGTRSFFAFMNGDIFSSFKYNAFVPYMILSSINIYIRVFIKVVLEKKIRVFPRDDRWIFIPLSMFLIYFILRNVV